jgi:CrcB protein
MLWLAIAIGGGLGAVARHAVSHLFNLRFGTTFPAGIFVVNAIGCLTIGLLAGLIASTRLHLGEVGRTFVFVGILGGSRRSRRTVSTPIRCSAAGTRDSACSTG